jgi:hypothetical protein
MADGAGAIPNRIPRKFGSKQLGSSILLIAVGVRGGSGVSGSSALCCICGSVSRFRNRDVAFRLLNQASGRLHGWVIGRLVGQSVQF